MSAYVVATVRRVQNRKALEAYWAKVGPTFEGTGAKPLAVYTPFKRIEGEGPVQAMVVIEFPDMETAEKWYGGPGYQTAKKYREGAADIDLIFVEGGVVKAPEKRMPHIL
jgi:uncharacterized protein (DUF1330 family)